MSRHGGEGHRGSLVRRENPVFGAVVSATSGSLASFESREGREGRQLASFFRRIRSVRDWLAERGEFEPRDPRLRACSAWVERETNSIEAPPAPGRPIALSESRSTSKMRSFPGSPSRIGPESHREQQEVSKIYGEGLLRRGLERGTTLGGLFPWAATFS
jgi:hypothetical protein